jgi:hypothetical protein
MENIFKKAKEVLGGIKEKIITPAKLAVLVLILISLAKEAGAATEGGGEYTDNLKMQIELANSIIKNIQFSNEGTRTLGKTEIQSQKFETENGKVEVVKAKDGSWIMLIAKDGTRVYYDKADSTGSFGSVDRIIRNDRPEEEQHSLTANSLYVFPPMQALAEDASTIAGLKPENVQVFEINGNGSVKVVDYSDPKQPVGVVPQAQAQGLIGSMQNAYTANLQSIE